MDRKEDAEVLKQLGQGMEHTVISALKQEGNEETIVFVDLSRFKTNVAENYSNINNFLDNIRSLSIYHRMVISVSSGIFVSTSDGTIDQNCVQFVSNFSSIVIEGFSDDEASQYVQKKNSTSSFKDIKYLTGNNPYLLSLIPNTEINEQHTLEQFKSILRGRLLQIVKAALNQHIKGVVKDV